MGCTVEECAACRPAVVGYCAAQLHVAFLLYLPVPGGHGLTGSRPGPSYLPRWVPL